MSPTNSTKGVAGLPIIRSQAEALVTLGRYALFHNNRSSTTSISWPNRSSYPASPARAASQAPESNFFPQKCIQQLLPQTERRSPMS